MREGSNAYNNPVPARRQARRLQVSCPSGDSSRPEQQATEMLGFQTCLEAGGAPEF
jgi:hypothetical protein